VRLPRNGLPLPSASYFFFAGSFLRLVLARSRSCFSDIDSAIFLDGPFKLDFFCSPRLAAKAAPAAFCCFFERAGILLYRLGPEGWSHTLAKAGEDSRRARERAIETPKEEIAKRGMTTVNFLTRIAHAFCSLFP
jgi:hypothetical protein